MSEVNERAVIGANGPPDEFITIASEVADLRAEALLHLDGVAVQTQAQCDALDSLYKTALALEAKADAARKEARKEADQIIAQIQAKYNPLITEAERIKKSARSGTVAWKKNLANIAAKEAARVAEDARIAREAAEAQARAAMDANNLEAIEEAEAQLANADTLDKMAKKAAKQIATGLKTFWQGMIVDYNAFARWHWVNRRSEIMAFLDSEMAKEVRNGARELPGCEIWSDKK